MKGSAPASDKHKLFNSEKGGKSCSMHFASRRSCPPRPPSVPMPPLPLGAPADDVLPNSRAEALSMEARDALPLTPFYEPPQPFEKASPGTLIRSEPFVGYSVPKGARAIRILYHSRALNDADIVASGVLLIPAGTAPQGGWPVIAWAHGTSGVARMCAPSLMKDMEYGEEGLMPMVAA